jgi:hypothetical protein
VREIGIAQHQADIGMGDEPTLGADHKSIAVLPDLDSRDDVPDELEIDLGDAASRRVPANASVM